MANKRISDLPEVTSSTIGDVLPIDGTTTRKITIENMLGDNLAAIKGLTSAEDKLAYFTGAGTATLTGLSLFGRTIINTSGAAGARTELGLVIGTDVQAYDSDLAAVAALATTGIIRRTGTGTATAGTAVTNAESATMANNTFKGNVSGSTAVPSDLTAAQVTAALPVATTSAKGLAPTLPSDATKYLDGTGSFSVPVGSAGTDASLLRGFISGLTLSTAGSSSTFAISPGSATDVAGGGFLKITSGTFTKTTSAWAVGSGNGALDTGTIANNTWYHVFVIERTDTSVVDSLISTSPTSPTLPSPYTLFRRIGSMKTDGSAKWTAFSQNGSEFLWATPLNDIAFPATLGTTAQTSTLTVPTGVKVNALINGFVTNSSICQVLVSSLDVPDNNPSTAGSNFQVPSASGFGTSDVSIRTNTSAQVRIRSTAASTTATLFTYGWVDPL